MSLPAYFWTGCSADKCAFFHALQEPTADWLAVSYKKFGCALEFVTNLSQEGSQFCRGFGGIGGVMLTCCAGGCRQYTLTYVCTQILHTCTHTCVHTYNIPSPTYMYSYIHAYHHSIHTYTSIYMYAHTYITTRIHRTTQKNSFTHTLFLFFCVYFFACACACGFVSCVVCL